MTTQEALSVPADQRLAQVEVEVMQQTKAQEIMQTQQQETMQTQSTQARSM
ncbi:hypothetical protein MP631_03150 [Xanthomonas phaseoli pv. phaseoli]|nr:hypothetical protein MP631_03150 [Xanthomonas phaseoli pv. phaseoli]